MYAPNSTHEVTAMAGMAHTAMLDVADVLRWFGNNRYRECAVPVVSCGYGHAVATTRRGQAICFADNTYGLCWTMGGANCDRSSTTGMYASGA